MKSERIFPTSTHQSDQLKSMEAQIQILVENMQTLQTKLTSRRTNSEQDQKIRRPVRAIIVIDQDTWQKIAENQRD